MKKYNSKIILIADDEPPNLFWLKDFIASLGYQVQFAITASEAIKLLQKEDYREVIVDLNIPEGEKGISDKQMDVLYDDFPGLKIAKAARSLGSSGIRVVIYSVYQTAALSEVASKLGCEYIPKGRPKLIKDAIKEIFEYDPKAKLN